METPFILHLSRYAYPVVGGIERQLKYIHDLDNSKFNIKIISFLDRKYENKDLLENATYIQDRFSNLSLLSSFIYAFVFFFYGLAFSLKHHVKIIHVHGMESLLAGWLLSKFTGAKLIMTLHMMHSRNASLKWFILNMLSGNASKIIFLTNFMKEYYTKFGIGKTNSDVLYNWGDENFFVPLNKKECRKNLDLPDKKIALYVGRFVPEKGALNLIEVANGFNEVFFVFIGSGPLVGKMREASANMKNITILENIPTNLLPSYYSAADVTVVPSVWDEPFGIVAAESMLCGTPVLASNRGSLPELISSNAGIVIEPDPDNLASGLKTMLNKNYSSEIIREYALSKMSSKNLSKLVGLYLLMLK